MLRDVSLVSVEKQQAIAEGKRVSCAPGGVAAARSCIPARKGWTHAQQALRQHRAQQPKKLWALAERGAAHEWRGSAGEMAAVLAAADGDGEGQSHSGRRGRMERRWQRDEERPLQRGLSSACI